MEKENHGGFKNMYGKPVIAIVIRSGEDARNAKKIYMAKAEMNKLDAENWKIK